MSLFSDNTSYSPLQLFEYDHQPGNFCLMLTDQHMVTVSAFFEAAGHEGHGYDWETICKQLVHQNPDLKERFRTDPEAGMFVAYGKDLEALKQLGQLMHQAFHDHAILADLIKDAPEDLWD